MGLRPDYATTVYCNLIRRTYKDVPIIIGGIEASLRRMAHYDYWSDKLKHSILVDSSADILSYGMGEHSMIEIAEALDSGIDVKDITFVRVHATGQRIYPVCPRIPLYCRIMTVFQRIDWNMQALYTVYKYRSILG